MLVAPARLKADGLVGRDDAAGAVADVDLQDLAHALDLLDRLVADGRRLLRRAAVALDRIVDAAEGRLVRRRRNRHRKQGSGHEGHTQESTLHAHLLW